MKPKSKGIVAWPEGERPRERLLRLLEDALLAVGSVDQARPPIRLIVARALQANASAVILGHNHPSGAAEASESDRLFTEDVLKALLQFRHWGEGKKEAGGDSRGALT